MRLLASIVGRVLVAAHRGASRHAPENTMIAFELAKAAGADLIELDVRKTSDRELVVIHSADVSSTTNGNGRVAELTLDEIRQLSAGFRFGSAFHSERVPTLQEVLNWAKNVKTCLMLDLKKLDAEAIGSAVQLVRDHRLSESTVIASFDMSVLEAVKAQCSSIRTSLLVDRLATKVPEFVCSSTVDMIQTSHAIWTAALITAAHEHGISACIWNVDVAGALEVTLNLDADVVMTSDPSSISKRFAEARRAYLKT